jgi:hypothetical protein
MKNNLNPPPKNGAKLAIKKSQISAPIDAILDSIKGVQVIE